MQFSISQQGLVSLTKDLFRDRRNSNCRSGTYNRFVPGTWDEDIWEEVAAMLSNDTWLDQ